MSIKGQYRFELTIDDGQAFAVNAIYQDTMTKDVVLEDNEMFFRESISEEFTFVRYDFDVIMSASFESKFKLEMFNQDTDALFWVGEFYKVDCEFDEDNRVVSVTPTSMDKYDDLVNKKEKVYDLLSLNPDRETIKYTKQPVIQLYIPGSNFVVNVLDGTWWEQPVIEPVLDTVVALPMTYKFGFDSIPNTVKNIIPNNSTSPLSPDVSGEYIQDGSGGTERVDNAYGIVYRNNGSGDQWTIVDRNNSDASVYVGPVGEQFLIGGWGGIDGELTQGVVLSSLSSSSECRIYAGYVMARYITNQETVNGTPTEPLPESDIVFDSYGFTRVLPLQVNTVIPFDGVQADPTRYGKVADYAVNNAGLYFNKPSPINNEKLYPLVNTEWQEASFWFYYTAALRDIQEDGAVTIVVKDAYPLASVIKVLLAEIAPELSYEEDSLHSEFLNDETNPISLEKNIRLFITPKTNIKVGDYDQPVKEADISLESVFMLLRMNYDLYYHVDSSGRLRIEHVSWYMNGGTYSGENIGLDLRQFVEPKHRKNWDFQRKVYDYDKPNMAERITFDWMDKTTEPFDGADILLLSPYVEKKNTDQRSASLFTSDISFISVQPSLIDNEGFCIIACESVLGEWVVPFQDVNVNGEDFKVQNGHVSNAYLHPRYHKYNLPVSSITLNGQADTATTIQKFKRLKITVPFQDVDPYQLIATSIGNGRLSSAKIRVSSETAETEILHNE